MSTALRTKDHEAIREWVEERGGHPAQVKGTGGLQRIDFGEPEESLDPISRNQCSEVLDQNGIVFLYGDQKNSPFNNLVTTRGNGEDEEEDEDEDDDDEEDEDDDDFLEDEDDEDLDEDEDEDDDELEEDDEEDEQ